MGGDAKTVTGAKGTPVYWGTEEADKKSTHYVWPEVADAARRAENQRFMEQSRASNVSNTPATSEQDAVAAAIETARQAAAASAQTGAPSASSPTATQPGVVKLPSLPGAEPGTGANSPAVTTTTQPGASAQSTAPQEQLNQAVTAGLTEIDQQNVVARRVLGNVRNLDAVLADQREQAKKSMALITDQDGLTKALQKRAEDLSKLQGKNPDQQKKLIEEFNKIETSFQNKLVELVKKSDKQIINQLNDQNKTFDGILKDIGTPELRSSIQTVNSNISGMLSGVTDSRALDDALRERQSALDQLRKELKDKKEGGLSEEEQTALAHRAQEIQAKFIKGFLRSTGEGTATTSPGAGPVALPALPGSEKNEQTSGSGGTQNTGAPKPNPLPTLKSNGPEKPAGETQGTTIAVTGTSQAQKTVVDVAVDQNRILLAVKKEVGSQNEYKDAEDGLATLEELLREHSSPTSDKGRIADLSKALEARGKSLDEILKLKEQLSQDGLSEPEKRTLNQRLKDLEEETSNKIFTILNPTK